MATHNHQSGSGLPNHTAAPAGPGESSTKKTSLPQYLSDSDEEDQMGFGYPDEKQEVDESPNTSLSSQSKFGEEEEDDDGDEDLEDEDVDDEGRERMDRAMDMSQGGYDYQLRQNINREAFKGSGFADHDKTGNYDPGEESDEELEMERVGRGRKRAGGGKRKRDKRKGKAKAVAKPKNNGEDRARAELEEEDDEEVADASQNADADYDDKSLGVIGELGLDASSPPQEDEEEESDSSDLELESEDLAANSNVDSEESRMRKAATKRRPRQTAVEPKPQSCRFCKSHALDCSIQDDPDSYPCLACQETGFACIVTSPYTSAQQSGTKRAQAKELKKAKEAEKAKLAREREIEREADRRRRELKKRLKEAARNRACTHCKDDGTTCSLEKLKEDEITGASCKRCVKHGHVCTVELPPASDDAEPEPQKTREPGQRPQAGMFGSPAFDRDDDEEEENDDANPPSIFNVADDGEPLPKRKRVRKLSQKSRKKSRLSNEIVPEVSPQDLYALPLGYAKKQITTSFCHPLVFNAPMPKGDEFNMACDFHLVAFSIFGHPSASPWVTYADPPTSQHAWKYEEIPGTGGHSESTKHEKTNVCKECTYARQKILFCQSHKLAGIKGLPEPKDYDFDAAYAPLLGDQERNFSSNTAAQHKWCAICPAPAFIECCSPFTAAPGQKEQEGCGLMLCEICAVGLLANPTPDLVFLPDSHVAQPQGELLTEEEATKEVASLIRDVKRLNIEIRSLQFSGQLRMLRARKSIEVRRSLEYVIEEAKMAVKAGGGKGGKYQDGVRADVEFISRRGWLFEWMGHEADRRRREAYEKTSIVGSSKTMMKKVVKKVKFAGLDRDVSGESDGAVTGGILGGSGSSTSELSMPRRSGVGAAAAGASVDCGGASTESGLPMPSRTRIA